MEIDKNSVELTTEDAVSRRNFFIKVLTASGQLALANTAIYSVSLFSSGGKFGGMTAGAKCAPWETAVGPYCCDGVAYDAWGAPYCI